jgi:spermidine synthase
VELVLLARIECCADRMREMSHRAKAAGILGIVGVVLIALLWLVPARAVEDTLVEKIESLYNDIYLYRRSDGYYILSFGARRLHYVESVVNPHDELELPVSYTRAMTAVSLYAAGLNDAAMIGLGGGRTSWYLHKSIPELRLSAAELDPAVVRIDAQYFGVKSEPNFEINTIDGRVFLARTDKSFDIVLVDAYRGPFVPFHLLTREFFTLAKKRLKPGGALVQNVEPSTMLFDSAVATISNVFTNLDFYKGEGNIVIVAYDGARKSAADLRRVAGERQGKYNFRYDMSKLLDLQFSPRVDWSKQPLTDDFAPTEYLRAIERHNEKRGE